MSKSTLNRLYPIILVLIVFIVWKIRQNNAQSEAISFTGRTMGPIPYNITYLSSDNIDLSDSVDALLKVWNQSLSTYIPESEISQFNHDSCFQFESKYFYPVLDKSKEIFKATNGAFDPSVGPLVNAWGFGPDKSENVPDSTLIDSLIQYVGFDHIHFEKNQVCKDIPEIQLDFSAIAKGYAVDVVAQYLAQHNIENYLVEIGGELICKGKNPEGKPWKIAIDDPRVEVYERKIYATISITNKAVATSGNYRNYYIKNGRKYAHTINPKTGYTVDHTLLSSTIIANDCMTADAYATAFMVLGLEKSKDILAKHPDLEALLVYSDNDGNLATYSSKELENIIEHVNATDK